MGREKFSCVGPDGIQCMCEFSLKEWKCWEDRDAEENWKGELEHGLRIGVFVNFSEYLNQFMTEICIENIYQI